MLCPEALSSYDLQIHLEKPTGKADELCYLYKFQICFT